MRSDHYQVKIILPYPIEIQCGWLDTTCKFNQEHPYYGKVFLDQNIDTFCTRYL